jgi:hypothetical protein
MKYSIAELLDMLTIVNIKLCMIDNRMVDENTDAMKALSLLSTMIMNRLQTAGASAAQTVVLGLVEDLAKVNLEIFQAVDDVLLLSDDKQVAEAARKAQKLNNLRSKLKATIDEFFESWSKEVKI